MIKVHGGMRGMPFVRVPLTVKPFFRTRSRIVLLVHPEKFYDNRYCFLGGIDICESSQKVILTNSLNMENMESQMASYLRHIFAAKNRIYNVYIIHTFQASV